jgi:hypothetical protein
MAIAGDDMSDGVAVKAYSTARRSLRAVPVFAAVATLFDGAAWAQNEYPTLSDDATLCQGREGQGWQIMMACDRVQFSLCSQLYRLNGTADRKCRYLLDYQPMPKGGCSFEEYMAKNRHCWSPSSDDEFTQVGH